MNILVWHLHGGWSSAFFSGDHHYFVPTAPEDALPIASPRVHPVSPFAPIEHRIDAVVLQRREELAWAEQLLGGRLGRDIPAIFVEHNTPKGMPVTERHFLADRRDIAIAHVTHFNRLVWDTGEAPTTVIEHGIVDPGPQYTGELAALAWIVNEPVRRWRVTGTDLLPLFAEAAPVHCFGIDAHLLAERFEREPGGDSGRIAPVADLPTRQLHSEAARRRAYLHTMRWTSLGLSLLEAMHLAMPVIVLDTTEASRAVPPEAGALSTDPDELARAARMLLEDPDEARRRGRAARDFAREHYSLERFLARWDEVLGDAVAQRRRRTRGSADLSLAQHVSCLTDPLTSHPWKGAAR